MGHPERTGEIGLIGAVLRQAVEDARGTHLSANNNPGAAQAIQADARAFLSDTDAVSFWCTLLGAEPEGMIETLRRAAGMRRRRENGRGKARVHRRTRWCP